MIPTYYNENDPYCVNRLRTLIKEGHLPAGDVDDRSIEEVSADDLTGYGDIHLFAGIGGWPLAIRISGIQEGHGIWTGSCPCQPFSIANQHKTDEDSRDLWGHFHRLIEKKRPALCFGEQVASPAGRSWFSTVRLQMEGLGYVTESADLCAASVGAPHIRQRLYWGSILPGYEGLDDTKIERGRTRITMEGGSGTELGGSSETSQLGYADRERLERRRLQPTKQQSQISAWQTSSVVLCADGKGRPIEPGIYPLAYGVPERVGKLRGFGNSIIPQLAAQFMLSFIESVEDVY